MGEIAIIGAPVDLGAGRRGVDMGPSAIRYAGLQERLEALGHRVRDMGNITVPLAEQIDAPVPGEKLRYLEPLVAIDKALAQQVRAVAAEGAFPLVLGGIFYREAHLAMELVADSGRLIGLDLLEVNPILDHHNVTAELAVEFALSALGQRIF